MQLGSGKNASIKNPTGGDRQLLKVDRFSRFVRSDGALVLLQGERLLFSHWRSKDTLKTTIRPAQAHNSEKQLIFYFCLFGSSEVYLELKPPAASFSFISDPKPLKATVNKSCINVNTAPQSPWKCARACGPCDRLRWLWPDLSLLSTWRVSAPELPAHRWERTGPKLRGRQKGVKSQAGSAESTF